ncbi:MAG: uL30 family ribosomal protein [Nanobdellota archaeon]
MSKLAAVRIRGSINAGSEVKDTLGMLKLYKKNYCGVYEDNASVRGMLQKCKDFITWGEIDEETRKELTDKKSEPNPANPDESKGFFRLNPPKGGMKSLKKPYSIGGDLGNRGKEINTLIKRML